MNKTFLLKEFNWLMKISNLQVFNGFFDDFGKYIIQFQLQS